MIDELISLAKEIEGFGLQSYAHVPTVMNDGQVTAQTRLLRQQLKKIFDAFDYKYDGLLDWLVVDEVCGDAGVRPSIYV